MAKLPPGIDTVQKVSGIRYRVRYRDGDGVQRMKTFVKLADAIGHQRTTAADLARGDWTDPRMAKEPFSIFAERWVETLAGRKPKTRSSYVSLLNARVLPYFGDRPVSKITYTDWQKLDSDLASLGLSESLRRNAFHVVKMVLNVAVNDGAIKTHPLIGRGKSPGKPALKGGERPVPTADEVDLMAETMLHRPYAALLRFLAWTGPRVTEALELRWADVDLVAHSAVMRNGGDRSGTKSKKDRTVYFPDFIADELVDLYDVEHETVFTGPMGGPVDLGTFRRDWFWPARELLPYGDLHLHDLRHTYVDLALDAGVDPFEIQRQLGHSSIDVTAIYEKRNGARVQRGLDALSALRRGAEVPA